MAKRWPTEDEAAFRRYLNTERMLRRRAFHDIMMALRIYKGEKLVSLEKTGDFSYRLTVQKGGTFRDVTVEDIRPFYRGCARDLLGIKKSCLRDRAYKKASFEELAARDRDRVMAAAWCAVSALAEQGMKVTKPVLTRILLGAREDDPELFAESAEEGKLPSIERNFFMYGAIPVPVEARPDMGSILEPDTACRLRAYVRTWAKESRQEGASCG